MKKIVLIYDDTIIPNDRIKTILGNRSFGEMVLKRKKMHSIVEDAIKNVKSDIDFIIIHNLKFLQKIEKYPNDTIFFHLLSNAAIVNQDEFEVLLEKLQYISSTITIKVDENLGIIFKTREEYIDFLREYINVKNIDFVKENIMDVNFLINLKDYDNLLMYISSGFDARFFNSLQGDKHTVTKSSKDKKKMKMEYSYYWLLPEDMKSWMVMPYNYKEYEDYASYTMERMPMTDVAIRWTHGAVDEQEFRNLMNKVFYFFSIRHTKKISNNEYIKNADNLYIDKVNKRIEDLKKCKEYTILQALISSGTNYNSIDDIIAEYVRLYKKYTKKYLKKTDTSVIGHGDVFFANMLYSKEVNLLRLIDPKGALEENDLWTDPYYDIAKLSHSVCGNYDFFNLGEYNIELEKDMKFKLNIYFDNTKYVEIFKEYLKNAGYDYTLVRLYESSLFLSMLPLHIDNVHKVFGFILNAVNILDEIK